MKRVEYFLDFAQELRRNVPRTWQYQLTQPHWRAPPVEGSERQLQQGVQQDFDRRADWTWDELE